MESIPPHATQWWATRWSGAAAHWSLLSKTGFDPLGKDQSLLYYQLCSQSCRGLGGQPLVKTSHAESTFTTENIPVCGFLFSKVIFIIVFSQTLSSCIIIKLSWAFLWGQGVAAKLLNLSWISHCVFTCVHKTFSWALASNFIAFLQQQKFIFKQKTFMYSWGRNTFQLMLRIVGPYLCDFYDL